MRVAKALLALLLVLVVGAGGYLIGAGAAPTDQESHTARTESRESAFRASYRQAAETAGVAGEASGRKQGLQRGTAAGRRDGRAAGEEKAAQRKAARAPASCPPGTAYFPDDDYYPGDQGGCYPIDNTVYENAPKGDAYGDQIPNQPGIQGE